MATRTKQAPARVSSARYSWKGMLRIDLVTIPVQAFNVVSGDGGDIHFNQLHAKCHSRIQYKKTCPIHGEISKDEIVSGFEYAKGKYVEFEPEELSTLRAKGDKSLTIDGFVRAGAIDLRYLDGRSYYLAPDGSFAVEPYEVLYSAMNKLDRWGIGLFVLSGREELALLRAEQGAMILSMLRFETEVRSPAEVGIDEPHADASKLALAKAVVDHATFKKFELEAYTNTHQEHLREMIDAKVAGKDVVETPDEDEEPPIINLMDALKKSLETSHGGAKKKPPARRGKPIAKGRKTPSRRSG